MNIDTSTQSFLSARSCSEVLTLLDVVLFSYQAHEIPCNSVFFSNNLNILIELIV